MVYIRAARRKVPMPWKETSAMSQKIQLIADWLSGDYRKSELCGVYGISRPTVDKWIGRYQELGTAGLEELSRAPQPHPNQVSDPPHKRLAATVTDRRKCLVKLVGTPRFELGASPTPRVRATRLRHVPSN